MTDITGTRIKRGDVLVFAESGEAAEALGFYVALHEDGGRFSGAAAWWEGLDNDTQVFKTCYPSFHHAWQTDGVLIVAHAARLDKPTWPRELRNWIYETWERHRQG